MSAQQPGSRSARPRQVTTAVVLAVVGGAVLVMSLFDTLAHVASPESRDAIDTVLRGPRGNGLGITTGQVVDVLRTLVFVSAALAAAIVVLGVFVAQRHRAARVALTVAAGLLLLTVPVSGLLPLVVAVAAGLLWSRPARDWYAGRAPSAASRPVPAVLSQDDNRPPAVLPEDDGPPPAPYPFGVGGSPRGAPYGQVTSEGGSPGSAPYGPGTSEGGSPGGAPDGAGASEGRPPGPDAPSRPGPWRQGPSGQPPQAVPYPPVGSPYDQGPEQQPGWVPGHGPAPQSAPFGGRPEHYGGPVPHGSTAWPGSPPVDRRPTTVTIAVVLTALGAGAVLAVTLLLGAVLAGASDAFVREFQSAAVDANVSLSEDEILAIGWVVAAFFAGWTLVSLLLAVFAFRRSNAARWALAASAVAAALLSLLMILSVVSLVTFALAAAATVLLFTGGANDWYARRSAWSGYVGPGGYPGGHPGAGYDQGHPAGPASGPAGQTGPWGAQGPPSEAGGSPGQHPQPGEGGPVAPPGQGHPGAGAQQPGWPRPDQPGWPPPEKGRNKPW